MNIPKVLCVPCGKRKFVLGYVLSSQSYRTLHLKKVRICVLLKRKKAKDFHPRPVCRFYRLYFVGVARFELATSWPQTRRDNRATLHPDGLS